MELEKKLACGRSGFAAAFQRDWFKNGFKMV